MCPRGARRSPRGHRRTAGRAHAESRLAATTRRGRTRGQRALRWPIMGGISTFRNVRKEGAHALGQRTRQTPPNDEEEGTMRTAVRLTVAIVVLVLVGTLAGPGTAQGKHKVAFIYVGPVGDAGWTYQHDQARQYLEQTLGDRKSTRLNSSHVKSSY